MGPADPEVPMLAVLREQNDGLRARLESLERYTAQALMRATRLAQVIGVLGSTEDLDRTIGRAAIVLSELFSADVTLLLIAGEDGLRLEGHWGLEAGAVPADRGAIDALAALAPRDAVTIDRAGPESLPDWLQGYGARNLAWVRLAVADQEIGLMLLMRRAEEQFSSEEETELRAIAHRIALAIENGLLQMRMRSQLAQLHRLQRLTAELAGTMELDEIATRLAETLVAEAGVGRCGVFIEHDGDSALLAAADERGRLEEPGDLEQAGYGACFSLSVGEHSVGHVMVADPPPQGTERFEMLVHLVRLGALALDKALLYDRSVEQARHDSLTGLLGHRVFHELLDRSLVDDEPFSVVMLDIDDFKQINDLHGHQRGDQVLCQVAEALRSTIRSGDWIFRVGGEEFCAILPGTGAHSAHIIADRLRAAVAQAGVRHAFPITLSAGVASYPEHAHVRDELLAAADAALYRSKRTGKNRTTLAGERATDAAPQMRVQGLELLLERDAETVTQCMNTAILAVTVARALGLDDERIADLHTAAKLHDVGNIGIPEAILQKAGPLEPFELQVLRTHPIIGSQLLEAWGFTRAARLVLQHHEHVDGSGYPSGARGEEIPLESRIIHAAAAYFAMLRPRPYRRARSEEGAIDELIRLRGTQFDADVVDTLLAILRGGIGSARQAA